MALVHKAHLDGLQFNLAGPARRWCGLQGIRSKNVVATLHWRHVEVDPHGRLDMHVNYCKLGPRAGDARPDDALADVPAHQHVDTLVHAPFVFENVSLQLLAAMGLEVQRIYDELSTDFPQFGTVLQLAGTTHVGFQPFSARAGRVGRRFGTTPSTFQYYFNCEPQAGYADGSPTGWPGIIRDVTLADFQRLLVNGRVEPPPASAASSGTTSSAARTPSSAAPPTFSAILQQQGGPPPASQRPPDPSSTSAGSSATSSCSAASFVAAAFSSAPAPAPSAAPAPAPPVAPAPAPAPAPPPSAPSPASSMPPPPPRPPASSVSPPQQRPQPLGPTQPSGPVPPQQQQLHLPELVRRFFGRGFPPADLFVVERWTSLVRILVAKLRDYELDPSELEPPDSISVRVELIEDALRIAAATDPPPAIEASSWSALFPRVQSYVREFRARRAASVAAAAPAAAPSAAAPSTAAASLGGPLGAVGSGSADLSSSLERHTQHHAFFAATTRTPSSADGSVAGDTTAPSTEGLRVQAQCAAGAIDHATRGPGFQGRAIAIGGLGGPSPPPTILGTGGAHDYTQFGELSSALASMEPELLRLDQAPAGSIQPNSSARLTSTVASISNSRMRYSERFQYLAVEYLCCPTDAHPLPEARKAQVRALGLKLLRCRFSFITIGELDGTAERLPIFALLLSAPSSPALAALPLNDRLALCKDHLKNLDRVTKIVHGLDGVSLWGGAEQQLRYLISSLRVDTTELAAPMHEALLQLDRGMIAFLEGTAPTRPPVDDSYFRSATYDLTIDSAKKRASNLRSLLTAPSMASTLPSLHGGGASGSAAQLPAAPVLPVGPLPGFQSAPLPAALQQLVQQPAPLLHGHDVAAAFMQQQAVLPPQPPPPLPQPVMHPVQPVMQPPPPAAPAPAPSNPRKKKKREGPPGGPASQDMVQAFIEYMRLNAPPLSAPRAPLPVSPAPAPTPAAPVTTDMISQWDGKLLPRARFNGILNPQFTGTPAAARPDKAGLAAFSLANPGPAGNQGLCWDFAMRGRCIRQKQFGACAFHHPHGVPM